MINYEYGEVIMEDYYDEGRELYKMGNFNQALSKFKNAYINFPENLNNLYAIGKTLALLNYFEESLDYFDKILDINHTHIKALIGKSISLTNLNNTNEALALINEEIRNSNNGYLLAVKGRILAFKHEENDLIENCFSNASEQSIDQSFLYYQRAKAYFHTLKYDKAISSYNKSIEYIDETFCGLDEGYYLTKFLILLEMSSVYCKTENYDLALDSVDEALAMNRKSIAGLYFKSYLFFEQENYDDAKDVLNVLLHLEPEHLDALNLKALIFDLEGSTKAAKNIYDQINEIDKNYKYSLGNMSLIYYNDNQYENALETAKKALDVDSSDPIALRIGSMAAKKLGEKSLARTWENKLSGKNVDTIFLEKNLQDKLINETWRLKKLGYNLKFIERELTLKDRPGRLDLLYRDLDTNELVVVELKVVPATKDTYYQIINYMDSISKTRASGKNVKGIVVSYGYDEPFEKLIGQNNDVSQIDYKKLGLD